MDALERSSKRRKIDDTGAQVGTGLHYEEIREENQATEEGKALAASNDTVPSFQEEFDTHGTKLNDVVPEDNAPSITVNTEQLTAPNPALSKNQRKKLRRKQEWEARREDRKALKKERRKEKKVRKRAARKEESKERLEDTTNDQENPATSNSQGQDQSKRHRPIQLPITIIFDCDFDGLMIDKERISLASQLTRSYSDNFKAKYRYHVAIASFGGSLKERFDTVLSKHYLNWKGVRIFEEDFVDVAAKSEAWLMEKQAGRLTGAFEKGCTSPTDGEKEQPTEESLRERGEIIYLTSDSPNTLTELKPYSTYVIGGLVDRNRHKGICYKRACDRGVKTARLPIGDYMEMTSRFVLATNHVAEIMLRWLEYRDWGKAFLEVMPKRKGGVLKETSGEAEEVDCEEEEHGGALATNEEEEDAGKECEGNGILEESNGEERVGEEENRGEEEANNGEVDGALENAIGMIVGETVESEGP